MEKVTIIMDVLTINRNWYLPSFPNDLAWGFDVTGVGSREAPAQASYDFEQGKLAQGRILADYGVVFVTRGQGYFHTTATGKVDISAGDLFFLFPGVWHDYRPVVQNGWDEYWIVFRGHYPDFLLRQGALSPDSPICHVGDDEQILSLFIQMMRLAEMRAPEVKPVLAALTMQILALAIAMTQRRQIHHQRHALAIQKAKKQMEAQCDGEMDINQLARSLHLSYRHFRQLFKEATGLAPHQYHLQLRLNRAKHLLASEGLPVCEVAARLGFSDPYYFSRLFTKKMGSTPSQWKR